MTEQIEQKIQKLAMEYGLGEPTIMRTCMRDDRERRHVYAVWGCGKYGVQAPYLSAMYCEAKMLGYVDNRSTLGGETKRNVSLTAFFHSMFSDPSAVAYEFRAFRGEPPCAGSLHTLRTGPILGAQPRAEPEAYPFPPKPDTPYWRTIYDEDTLSAHVPDSCAEYMDKLHVSLLDLVKARHQTLQQEWSPEVIWEGEVPLSYRGLPSCDIEINKYVLHNTCLYLKHFSQINHWDVLWTLCVQSLTDIEARKNLVFNYQSFVAPVLLTNMPYAPEYSPLDLEPHTFSLSHSPFPYGR